MDNRIRRLGRRLAWLQVGYGFAVVTSGFLAILSTTILVVDLSVLFAPSLPGATVVQLSKALLSTVAAVVAIYWIALPLHRGLGQRQCLGLIEQSLGRESYLETTLNLPQEWRPNGSESGSLLDELLARSARDLDQVRLSSIAPMHRFWGAAVTFLLLGSLSLAGAMARPDLVKDGLARILDTRRIPATSQAETQPESTLPAETPESAPRPPPCQQVKVQVVPPAYLDVSPYPIDWNRPAEVLVGSTIQLACDSSPGRPVPLLTVAGKNFESQLEFETVDSGDPMQRRFVVKHAVRQDIRMRISSAKGETWQPGAQSLVAIPDASPVCSLLSPESERQVRPAESLTVLVKAEDDLALGTVLLRYRVAGLDDEWNSIELAKLRQQRKTLVQRDIPVSSFGADPGDQVELYVEVRDGREGGPGGACETAHQTVSVHSIRLEQEDLIRAIAELRNTTISQTGRALVLLHTREWEEGALPDFATALIHHIETLESAARHMSDISLFKSEDTRRMLALPGSLEDTGIDDLMSEELSAMRLRTILLAVQQELEKQVFVLDGVTEKLVGEYLFRLSGKVQQELARLVSLSRSPGGQEGVSRSLERATRKLGRTARHIIELRQATLATVPLLFTSTLSQGQADRFHRVMELSQALSGQVNSFGSDEWSQALEALSQVVDQAARSVEGAYAQSMNRLSASFRNAQEDVKQRLSDALKDARLLETGLETLIAEVEAETNSFVKRRTTIAALRDVARQLSRVTRETRRFRASVYLPVDRAQVKEFRNRLEKTREAVALVRLEDARERVEELTALTRSMEFSLNLTIEYSQDKKLVKKSNEELAKVRKVRSHLNTITGKLAVARPQRDQLKSLRSKKLASLKESVENLLSHSRRLLEDIGTLQKMFPVFFGRLVPGSERLVETYVRIENNLETLLLEDALDLTHYSQEHLTRLLDILEQSQKSAKGASTLGAGGAQPGIELAGKERRISKEELQQYLELSAQFGEGNEWRNVIDTYFSRLSQ